jgi:dethiobiotin synthetase
LFFTGTDTHAGKTFVAAAVARLLRGRGRQVGVCKPVATGAACIGGRLVSEDTLRLAEAAGYESLLTRVTPFTFAEPAAPPVAAAAVGQALVLEDLAAAARWWESRTDIVLVEGVGGLLTPLTADATVADLIRALAFPAVIVARTSLGTLNHTLLTVEAAERRDLPIAGVLLNECTMPDGSLAEETSARELGCRLRVPVLGVVKHRRTTRIGAIPELEAVDWHSLAGGGGESK